MSRLTYKFRLYPNKEQESRLLEALDLCRWLYNYFLAQWKDKVPSRYELQAQLPKLKKEKTELDKVYSKVLQMVLHQLYSNLKALSEAKKKGRKVGRLRFKGKGWYKCLNYNQSGFKLIRTGNRLDKLYLSKIGAIPIRLHREIEGNIKGIIVKRYATGEWYALVQAENHPEPQPKTGGVIGIDVGIKHFLTDSEGRQIENPRAYDKTLRKLRRRHREVSRKKQGSKNRTKAKIRLAKAYQKLVNQRDDFLHKLSRFYVDNYDLIAIEDLRITNMVKNSHLASEILDASWGKFFQMLSYKAASAGKIVLKVNPRGTSQEYNFGELDRDYNASLNILARALPKGLGEVTPVEIDPLLRQVGARSVVEAGSPMRSVG